MLEFLRRRGSESSLPHTLLPNLLIPQLLIVLMIEREAIYKSESSLLESGLELLGVT
jgi:hypothetical protein